MPRQSTATGRGRRLLAGLAALSALTGLIGGLPPLLTYSEGVLLPSGWTTLADLPSALAAPDDGSLLVQAVLAAGWITWVTFCVLVVWEVIRRLLGRPPATGSRLPTPRGLAGLLVAAVAALATPAANAAQAAPAAVVAIEDLHPGQDQPSPPARHIASSEPALHLVQRGEALLDLQERYGVPWQRIAEANYDREQPDGQVLRRGRTVVHAGWQLRIPPPATGPAAAASGDSAPAAGNQPATAPTTGHTNPPPEPSTGQTTEAADPQPGPQRLRYEVVRGDWMWHIADRYLGDPHRYPDIAVLNPHLDARYDDYPDHIEPGDTLLLPADAHDRGARQHATGDVTPVAEPPTPAPPEPEPPPPPEGPDRSAGSPTPQPPPPSPVTPTDPDGVVPDPAATATPTPGPTAGEQTTSPTPSADAYPSPGSGAAGEDADDGPADDGDGVVLGDGSWIPWAVAAAVAAAMAVVWLQRRRRYRPRRLDDTDADTGELYREEDPDPAALAEPAIVSRIRRGLRSRSRGDVPHTTHEPESEPDEPAPAPGPGPQPEPEPEVARPVPSAGVGPDQQQAPLQAAAVELLPEGGTGIVGPGAEAAARGALVAALSAGAPVDPDAQTEVVVPAEVMVTLLGADAVTLGTWRRLRVTPDPDSALALVEARLLSTARLLDEYETEDLAGLRAAAPAERPVPPLLLITTAPQAEARMRTRNALGLGHGVGVSALLLGTWGHGPTVQVEVDGTCRPATSGADLPPGIPPRMAVLDQQAAFELLATLREAHTGQAAPPAAAGAAPAAPAIEPSASAEGADHQPHDEKTTPSGREDAQRPVHEPAEPAPSAGGEAVGQEDLPVGVPTARARVLGMPEIEGWQTAGRPLRKAAVELLVYLACHPDGAAPEQIQEDLWPDSRRRLAATKLHTAASNLRHLLAAAASADGEQAGAYVRKDKGRYRIPAGPVEIDLWMLRAECDRARRATDPGEQVAALRRACQAYRGELAAGRDYEWVTVHREAARALALHAHTTLAEAIADEDPGQAARLLLAAVQVDPMAEAVYRQAMQACHRVGDGQTIRSLLRQLAGQLEAVGGEPADETIELAEKLHAELNQRPGPAGAA